MGLLSESFFHEVSLIMPYIRSLATIGLFLILASAALGMPPPQEILLS